MRARESERERERDRERQREKERGREREQERKKVKEGKREREKALKKNLSTQKIDIPNKNVCLHVKLLVCWAGSRKIDRLEEENIFYI